MRIAEILTDGIVFSVYEEDEVAEQNIHLRVGMEFAFPLLGYFECPPEVKQNWTYADGEFIPPPPPEPPTPPTLEEAQATKRNELMSTRDEVIAAGFSYHGHTYPITPDQQSLLMIEYMGSQVLQAPSYPWKDKDGIYRAIGDAAAFAAFCAAAMAYGKSVFSREEMLQACTEACGSAEELEVITWDYVPEHAI